MADRKHSEVPAAVDASDIQSKSGIAPSAPSTGTAGWGTTPDEKRKQVSQLNPEASSQGPHTHGNRSFRCADAVQKDCGWSVTGNAEDEILGYIRAHVRQAHGKNEFTPKELADARRAIRKRAA